MLFITLLGMCNAEARSELKRDEQKESRGAGLSDGLGSAISRKREKSPSGQPYGGTACASRKLADRQ